MVILFMVVHYRLPGVVASGALIYYALVVLALFRLIPVTLTLAGIAGFVLSVGMAVDANILIFERIKEELRVGKSLPAAIEAGFARAWNSILDSNVSSLITATILFLFGSSMIRGFALVLIIGVLSRCSRAIVVTRTVLRIVVAQPWARKAAVRRQRGGVRCARPTTGRPRPERRARVFDIIGKRRWFFLLSLLITIPGLIFILLSPSPAARRPAVRDRLHRRHRSGRSGSRTRTSRPSRSRPCSRAAASEATVTKQGDGFIDIRTERSASRAGPAPDARPSPSSPAPSAARRSGVAPARRPAARRLGVAPARPRRRRRRPRPPRLGQPRRRRQPVGLARSASASPAPSPSPTARRPAASDADRRASSARSRSRSRRSSARSPSRPR